MDLHLMSAEPSAEERAAVDAVVGPPETGWEGGARTAVDLRVARAPVETRTLLLPALHGLQAAIGWISEGGLNYVCERLMVPPAEAYGVASFYAMFTTKLRTTATIHVCDDLACRIAGGRELLAACELELTDVAVTSSPCLGMCEQAPAVLVQNVGGVPDRALGAPGSGVGQVRRAVAGEAITGAVAHTDMRPGAAVSGERLLARFGVADPSSLESYREHGGYAALVRAIELGPDGVIQQITDAKLLGRGGAAFPTGVKWRAVADQPVTPKYVICNADESEPGTFKDRIVMERDPFAVIEALTIAGLATGAQRGFLYIRGEYPLATRRLADAIDQARDAGLLGADVLGSGSAFDIELRRGAGAYICGEETALFNSIEGKRGEPRNKPPFPVTHGVFGKPTSINNVETLINVLQILTSGVDGFMSMGTADSTGTRLFCLSGHVERPGLYEHPHGVTLGEVIAGAGGVRRGRSARAVLLGGAAGGFVGADSLDVRLTFEDARAGGYTLGSGVVMVFDDSTDLVDLCLRIARFFRDESCGQCVPCRVGTVRQEEALHRLVSGRTLGSRADELDLLADVAAVMRDASICGLGQTAASAVQSAIATFDLFDGVSA